MIREDRELLAELARLNTDMAPFCMLIMEGSATASEQQRYADRLIAAGERLRIRVKTMESMVVEGTVMEGEVVEGQIALTSIDESGKSVALPPHTVEPDWKP